MTRTIEELWSQTETRGRFKTRAAAEAAVLKSYARHLQERRLREEGIVTVFRDGLGFSDDVHAWSAVAMDLGGHHRKDDLHREALELFLTKSPSE